MNLYKKQAGTLHQNIILLLISYVCCKQHIEGIHNNMDRHIYFAYIVFELSVTTIDGSRPRSMNVTPP